MRNPYVVIFISLWLLYYALFRYKGDKQSRILLLIISFSSTIASVAMILEDVFPQIKRNIGDIFQYPVYLGIFAMIFWCFVMTPKMLKNPATRIHAKIFLYAMGVVILVIAIGVPLINSGFFK